MLAGGDRFVSLVQWLAFVGSGIAVGLIAEELGAKLRGEVLAAFLCTALPQGICPGCPDHKEKWDEYVSRLPIARTFGDLVPPALAETGQPPRSR